MADIMENNVVFTNYVAEEIDRYAAVLNPSRIFVLVDRNTQEAALPVLASQSRCVGDATVLVVKPGDENKNIESLSYIWQQLGDNGATRRSLLINLGGGVVTDMGAFAAATFKRGIHFVNVPTSLLAAVDASVGGKTGINFNGLKNEVGVFKDADLVIVSSIFFNTLSATEMRSGYGEMLKHALIKGPDMLADLMRHDVLEVGRERMLDLLKENVGVKQDVVSQDPTEKGLRKALNLGHTTGHAFESLALRRKSPIPHGYAVAYGIVVELILSVMKTGFPSETMRKIATYIYENYRAFAVTCDDYEEIIDLMRHDKKNANVSEINFTLLKNVGEIALDQTASVDEIKAALDIYRDVMHLD